MGGLLGQVPFCAIVALIVADAEPELHITDVVQVGESGEELLREKIQVAVLRANGLQLGDQV